MAKRFDGVLDTLRADGLIPASCQAVLLVGSAARGWVNASSDYDIYLVSTEPWYGKSGSELQLPLDPPTVPTVVRHAGGRRWELKYWLETQVDQMLAKVSWDQYSRGLVAGQLLTDVEEVFLERLVTCVALADAGWLDKRRSELESCAFKAFVITRSLAWADDSIEDATGQLEAEDMESAVLSARKAFGHTIDALLESKGQYGYYTPKWRARRMREAAPDEIKFSRYWDFETMRFLDAKAPREWVRSVVETCRDLIMSIEIPESETE